MRRLTRSILSFGWALPAFGLEQMSRMGSRDTRDTMADALDAVTAALCEDLGKAPKGLFQVGSTLQNNMVDLAFSVTGTVTGLGARGRSANHGNGAEPAGGESPIAGTAPGSAGATRGDFFEPSRTGIDLIGGRTDSASSNGDPASFGAAIEGAGGWGPVPSRETLPWPDPVDGWGPMPTDLATADPSSEIGGPAGPTESDGSS